MFEPLVYAWNHGSFGYLLLLLLLLLFPSTRSHIWFLSLFVFFWGGGEGVLLVGWLVGLVRWMYNSTEFFPVGFMGVGESVVHILYTSHSIGLYLFVKTHVVRIVL